MAADWKSKARERVSDMAQGNRLALTVGDNCLRCLPDKKDITPDGKVKKEGLIHSPVREFRIHYGVGPDKATLGCGHPIDGSGSCWLCDDLIPQLEKNPNKRALVNPTTRDNILGKDCFVINASKYDPNTQRFGAARPWWPSVGGGNSLAVRVYSRISTSKKDYIDPVKGYNMTIEKTGEGINTRYPSIEADESPTRVDPKVLIGMKDLDEIVPAYSMEEQKNAYYGRAPEDEPEAEEDAVEDPDSAEDPDAVEETEEPVEEVEETPEEEVVEESFGEPEDEPDPDAPEEEYEAEPEPEPEPPKPVRRTAPVKTAPAPARKTAPPAPAKKAAPAPARRK